MTIKEFEKHNKERTMPREWIGQGWGYKAEWNPLASEDIIYIPEYGYEDEGFVPREDAFSYSDFLKICDGNEKKAEILFQCVDWQFPECVLDEPWFECDDEEVLL